MAQTLPNGVVVPNTDGQEPISATGIQEMRTLGSSVDSQLASKASTEYVDDELSAIMPRMFYRGLLPFNTNVDDLYAVADAGMWTISNASQAATILGLPEQVPSERRRGQILILPIGAGVASQFYFPYGYGGFTETWYRNTSWAGSTETPHTFNAWVDLARGGAGLGEGFKVAGAGMANEVLREQMARRRGGSIGIGDKGAFAFRFDHGLNGFRSKVVPLLRKWNLPSSQAYLSEMFDGTTSAPDESTQSSWAEVREWALNAGVEPMAHSATHLDAGTEARLIAEIVGCYEALSAAIPESAIESWAVPGGGGTEYMGFNDGDAPDRFYDTRAGELLLSTYAFSMGHIPGGEWHLDGRAPQGSRHSTVDTSQALNAARTNVERAVEQRTGYVVMLHPKFLDEAGGYTSTDELDSFLGFIAGLRDAGQLEVMTIGGLVHARTGTNRRLNLVTGGTFGTGWQSNFTDTGSYLTATENGIRYISASAGGTVKHELPVRKLYPVRGAVYEVTATVRSKQGGTARIGSSSITGALRDVVLPASGVWREIRQYVTIPLNSNDPFNVEVGRIAGTVDVMNFHVQPI